MSYLFENIAFWIARRLHTSRLTVLIKCAAPWWPGLGICFGFMVMAGCGSPEPAAAGNTLAVIDDWPGGSIVFAEPSGLVFHEQRGTLFVVGDEGHIGEVGLDGSLLRSSRLRHADFEDITYVPATGLLYLVIEGEEQILEVDPDDLTVRRTFAIDRFFDGRLLLGPGGQGVEGITFVPAAEEPNGGTFFLVNQGGGAIEDDPPVVFELAVPLKGTETEGQAQIVRYFSLGRADLSGLYYDAIQANFFVISDVSDRLWQVSLSGELVASYELPGQTQEGIAVDDQGFLYVAQDAGGIIKLAWGRQLNE